MFHGPNSASVCVLGVLPLEKAHSQYSSGLVEVRHALRMETRHHGTPSRPFMRVEDGTLANNVPPSARMNGLDGVPRLCIEARIINLR